MVFQWSLSESKYPHVSMTLLSILSNLNNAIIGKVSILVLISNSSISFTNPLVTLLSAPITLGVIVIFMFGKFNDLLDQLQHKVKGLNIWTLQFIKQEWQF